MKQEFKKGVQVAIPLCIGYFSVSFGIGVFAIRQGLSTATAVIISLTNLTSAGQVAGISVIAASGSYLEILLTQLLINCRYSLMALSLSQNVSDDFGPKKRLIGAMGITDEIFGICATREAKITPSFLYGVEAISILGWVSGTWLGALSGEALPERVSAALGIMLYGMFVAIIVPPARDSKTNFAAIIIAALCSVIMYYFMPSISSGFQVIIAAVIAAVTMSIIAPITNKEEA